MHKEEYLFSLAEMMKHVTLSVFVCIVYTCIINYHGLVIKAMCVLWGVRRLEHKD